MSVVVTEAVADAEGTDPAALSPPLYEIIDTDALNGLIDTTERATRVTFTYHSYTITVHGDCHVTLEKRRE